MTTPNALFKATKTNINPYILEPKVRKIAVDNYEGKIIVEADYANKIMWIADGEILKTKFNVVGKFKTKFNVENLECTKLYFKLIGDGGETASKPFSLVKAV